MFKLTINNISTVDEAIRIAEDGLKSGSLMWSNDDDGITRAYPDLTTCIEIKPE